MKKFCISLVFLFIIILLILVGAGENPARAEYLRIHIRANSNSEKDQSIKIAVRDEVVKYLTPYISECNDKEAAIEMLESRKNEINRLIERFLAKNGFNYGARTSVKRESFPTRVYEDVTLEAGVYDALIIELGSGSGDNWWCVVYPPLCFTGTENVRYKSKIYDIIKNFNKTK